MIEISIGGVPRDIKYADESWINQEVNGRREDGESVCLRITIKTTEIDLTFSTPGCAGRGRGLQRTLTRAENEVHDLWKKRGLSSDDFSGGNVVAFLKQLQHIV